MCDVHSTFFVMLCHIMNFFFFFFLRFFVCVCVCFLFFFCCGAHKKEERENETAFTSSQLGVQVALIAMATLITKVTSDKIADKEGAPVIAQILSWLILCKSVVTENLSVAPVQDILLL